MAAVAEGAGNTLPMDFILFPKLIGICMTGLAFRGAVGRVPDKDEDEVDSKEYPCHRRADQPRLL